MSVRVWLAASVLAVVGLLVLDRKPFTVSPLEAAAAADPEPRSSSLSDQVDLAVTVYNSEIALVRDVRTLQLPRGVFDLRFMDIAATVNPATVHFRSLTEPSRISVLEQNYEYDLLEPEKLLRKYVGRDVTLVRLRQENGATVSEDVKAKLLSFNNAPVWRIGDEIVTGMHADHIRFPDLPENLFARPTLIWSIQNSGVNSHRVEASYLAGKLSWVTLTNGSGTSFKNAKLQLVAGDLNRVRQVIGRMMLDEARVAKEAAAAPMAQEAFSDYHLYSLGRKTTINNSETKQVSMLGATGVPIQKRYVVDGQAFYYRNAQHPGAPLKDVVQVYYQFKNEERGNLGMPMPALSASTSPIRRAVCSSSVRIASATRQRTRCSTSRSAMRSTWSPSGNRWTSRKSPRAFTRSNTRSRCATTRLCRLPSK
jgi:hypothetical protein